MIHANEQLSITADNRISIDQFFRKLHAKHWLNEQEESWLRIIRACNRRFAPHFTEEESLSLAYEAMATCESDLTRANVKARLRQAHLHALRAQAKPYNRRRARLQRHKVKHRANTSEPSYTHKGFTMIEDADLLQQFKTRYPLYAPIIAMLVDGYSFKEIAEALHIPRTTFYRTIHQMSDDLDALHDGIY